MVFSSLIFTFGFLPPLLILAAASSRRINIQNVLLLIASFLFYAWGEPERIWLFIATIIGNWLLVLIACSFENCLTKKMLGVLAIGFDIAILFYFKYAGWIGNGLGLSIGSVTLPVGISFYTFQAISYVADVTLMNKYAAERDPVKVGLYIAFFPQLIAGPILRYEDMKEQIRNRKMSMDMFEKGCFRFIFGFCKKILLADTMGIIVNKAFSDVAGLTTSFAWLGAIAYTFQIFMDFSGYSDMAIGLGAMFGFRIPENFNCPYKADSIRDFWRRWHITLSIWFRDYLYIPLGGNRKGNRRTILNISLVWLFTGIWHGANLTFVMWGVIYGIFVLFEKETDIDSKLENWGTAKRILYRLWTLLVIILLWVVFRAENIESACEYIGHMFLFDSGRIDETILYISEMKWSLICCTILSMVPYDKVREHRTGLWPVMLVLFVVSISYLVKGSFSPFLYFNF